MTPSAAVPALWLVALGGAFAFTAHLLWNVRHCWKFETPRRCQTTNRLVLAKTFHLPFYMICGILLALRIAFFVALITVDDLASYVSGVFFFFWLLEMPTVCLVALHGYLILFFASIVHFHRWSTQLTWLLIRWSGGRLFLVLCSVLVLLTTLTAILRDYLAQTPSSASTALPLTMREMDYMYSAYMAWIWSVLGLMLLKYQAKGIHIMWQERRLHRLRILNAPCVHHMAVYNTLLVILLLLRGVANASMLLISDMSIVDEDGVIPTTNPRDKDTWSFMWILMVKYVGWEAVIVAVTFAMLKKVPIAYHYVSDGSSTMARATAAMGTICRNELRHSESVVTYHFQLPTVGDLVQDYVKNASSSFQQKARLDRYDQLFYDDDDSPDNGNMCNHSSSYATGTEYLGCQCHLKTTSLANANVPLLSDEIAPVKEPCNTKHSDEGYYDENSSSIPLQFD